MGEKILDDNSEITIFVRVLTKQNKEIQYLGLELCHALSSSLVNFEAYVVNDKLIRD